MLVGFHTSDTEMTLFPRGGKVRAAVEVDFCGTGDGHLMLDRQHGAAVQKEMGIIQMAVNTCRFDGKTDVSHEYSTNTRPK